MADGMPPTPGIGGGPSIPGSALLGALNAGHPGQPPFGSSPMTMPTPNRGNEVEAIALVRGAVTALKEALRLLEPGSELFRLVNKVMEQLERDVPAAQMTPGIERSAMLRFLLARRAENPLLGVLASMRQGGDMPNAGATPPPSPTPPASPVAAGAV